MRLFIIILITGCFCSRSSAQDPGSIRINSVSSDSSMLHGTVYRYPQFIKGSIVFKNQKQAVAPVNYNRLAGQVFFINSKGDTLEPANPEAIEFVEISGDTFRYNQPGFSEKITHNPEGFNLYKTELVRYTGKEKKGAYGGYSSTSAASAINKVSTGNNIEKIGIDENQVFDLSVRYYLRSPSGNFYPANKKNFKNLFHHKGKALEAFLKQHGINFNKEKDLEQLLRYLLN